MLGILVRKSGKLKRLKILLIASILLLIGGILQLILN